MLNGKKVLWVYSKDRVSREIRLNVYRNLWETRGVSLRINTFHNCFLMIRRWETTLRCQFFLSCYTQLDFIYLVEKRAVCLLKVIAVCAHSLSAENKPWLLLPKQGKSHLKPYKWPMVNWFCVEVSYRITVIFYRYSISWFQLSVFRTRDTGVIIPTYRRISVLSNNNKSTRNFLMLWN